MQHALPARTAPGNLHGTDSRENQQVSDWANQSLWSQTPREQIDVASARAALSDARGAAALHQASDPQLHTLLNEFMGLAHDLQASQRDRSNFDDLERQIAELRSQLATDNRSAY
jgi:hypothetical protein